MARISVELSCTAVWGPPRAQAWAGWAELPLFSDIGGLGGKNTRLLPGFLQERYRGPSLRATDAVFAPGASTETSIWTCAPEVQAEDWNNPISRFHYRDNLPDVLHGLVRVVY